MKPARIPAVLALLALTACPAGQPPTPASLSVAFSGLPGGTLPNLQASGPGGFTRTLTAPATLDGLTPGTYTLVEGPVPGYAVSAIACHTPSGPGADDATTDLPARSASVPLDPGEAAACTFTFSAASSVPTDPLAFTPDTPVQSGPDWVDVPASYDATHHTPMALLVWLHGCGGLASGDVYTVSPAGRDWIT
ncbi:MAG TPA: hypothetical protein VHN99_10120, partial [Deinococcales bacterium]|nr:hypothetical protein [Deinococcales bacterium]